MLKQSDSVLLRRNRDLMTAILLFGVFATEGILVTLFDNRPLGYLITMSCDITVVYWAVRLLTPAEVLLELPASHFLWMASSEPEVQSGRPERQQLTDGSASETPRSQITNMTGILE